MPGVTGVKLRLELWPSRSYGLVAAGSEDLRTYHGDIQGCSSLSKLNTVKQKLEFISCKQSKSLEKSRK